MMRVQLIGGGDNTDMCLSNRVSMAGGTTKEEKKCPEALSRLSGLLTPKGVEYERFNPKNYPTTM